MKQNHNNKTTLSSNEICLLSSTWPQGAAHLPGLTSWVWFMPLHFHSNVLQSRGRNIYSHLRITNEVYRNKEVTECTNSPSQILSTIWGDYTLLQLREAYWERSPVDVLRTWPLLVCGPGEGDTQMYGHGAHSVEAYKCGGGDQTKMNGTIREQVPNSKRKRNSEKGEGANGM